MFLWTVRSTRKFLLSIVEILSDYTYRSTSSKLPTKRNKFAWVKLSLYIYILRFSRLSFTRHNDNILGQKYPLQGVSNQFLHPEPRIRGCSKNVRSIRSRWPDWFFDTPISEILHKTLSTGNRKYRLQNC